MVNGFKQDGSNISGVTLSGIWMMVIRTPITLWQSVSLILFGIFLDSDYTIFTWRQNSPSTPGQAMPFTLYVHDPTGQLPEPPAYRNPSFYLFQPSRSVLPRSHSQRSCREKKQKTVEVESRAAKHRKEFEKFHSENGVRTVMGIIGPVENGTFHSYILRSRRPGKG